jgi:flagellar basal-body rod protein FlgF
MIKGLYAAASAMLVGVNRQNVLAHNVSNMDTPGFKQVLTSMDDFYNTPVLNPLTGTTNPLDTSFIGDLGLGVENSPEKIDFTGGALQQTGQPLDLAIQGDGFFQVRTPDGERYTRDGRFLQDAQGQLVTVDGYLVLDDAGQPIKLTADGEISVSGDGTIFQNGTQVARLGLASFANPAAELVRDQGNAFIANGQPTGQQTGVVAQGYLEASNVEPAQVMTQMVQVARQYEAAQQMVQNQDELLGEAISSLGRL